MLNSDILIGDIMLARIKDVGEVEVVAIAPHRGSMDNPMLFLFKEEISFILKFCIDKKYIESTPKVSRKYLGWYAARIWPTEIVRLVDRPKKIGDKVRISCLMQDGKINKFQKPNDPNSDVCDLEIIAVTFNKSFWQYEYLVHIPPGSPIGIVFGEEDLKLWNVDDTKFVGGLFRPVLSSEICSVEIVQKTTGMSCMNKYCREFCPWVDQTNCPNNIFLCYRCRTNPMTYLTVVEGYDE